MAPSFPSSLRAFARVFASLLFSSAAYFFASSSRDAASKVAPPKTTTAIAAMIRRFMANLLKDATADGRGLVKDRTLGDGPSSVCNDHDPPMTKECHAQCPNCQPLVIGIWSLVVPWTLAGHWSLTAASIRRRFVIPLDRLLGVIGDLVAFQVAHLAFSVLGFPLEAELVALLLGREVTLLLVVGHFAIDRTILVAGIFGGQHAAVAAGVHDELHHVVFLECNLHVEVADLPLERAGQIFFLVVGDCGPGEQAGGEHGEDGKGAHARLLSMGDQRIDVALRGMRPEGSRTFLMSPTATNRRSARASRAGPPRSASLARTALDAERLASGRAGRFRGQS